MARLTLAYLALMLTATHAAFRVLRSGGPRAACRPVAAGPRAAALFATLSPVPLTYAPKVARSTLQQDTVAVATSGGITDCDGSRRAVHA